MRCFLVAFLLALTVVVGAQPIRQFERLPYVPPSTQTASAIHVGTDALGNHTIVYNTKTGDVVGIRVVKINSQGNAVWNRTLAGNPSIAASRAVTLVDGTTFLVGTFQSGSQRKAMVRRIDANGTVTGRELAENPWQDFADDVVVHSGAIYIAGTTRTNQSNPIYRGVLYRLSSALLIQWKQLTPLKDHRRLRRLPNGNLVTFGPSANGFGVAVYRPDGALIGWDESAANTGYCTGDVTPTGEIYAAGIRNASGNRGFARIARFSPSGQALWSRELGSLDIYRPFTLTVLGLAAGGAIVAWKEDTAVVTGHRLRMTRVTSAGTNAWNRTVTPNIVNEGLRLARDSRDNVLLARTNKPATGSNVVVDATNLSGQVMWEFTYKHSSLLGAISQLEIAPNGILTLMSTWAFAAYSPLQSLEMSGPIAPGGTGNLIARFAYATQGSHPLELTGSGAMFPPSVVVPSNQLSHMVQVTGQGLPGQAHGINGWYLRAFATAGFTLAPPVQSVSVTPNDVVGGKTVSVTVRLSGPAPTGGARVRLIRPTVPGFAEMTIAAGASAQTQTFLTGHVATPVTGNVRAFYAGTEASTSLTVRPTNLAGLIAPLSVTAPATINVRVELNGPAPAGGFIVSLVSSAPATLPLPATISFPPGTSARSIPVSVARPIRSTNVTLTARYGTTTRTAVVLVRP